jgi:hypothetical protein
LHEIDVKWNGQLNIPNYSGEQIQEFKDASHPAGHYAHPLVVMQLASRFQELAIMLGTGGRLFTTTDELFVFGLADIREGDQVWIVRDARVPYILRTAEDGSGRFEFVGEAYVHGVTQGDPMQDIGTGAFRELTLQEMRY